MVRLGLIDSGLAPELVAAGACSLGPGPDRHGHGSAVSRILATRVAPHALIGVPVFDERGVTTPVAVAQALAGLVEQGAGLVLMALGVAQDRDVLRSACAHAVGHGVVLVASAPARGGACFPAAYPGVLSVCGDARCGPDQISWLGGRPALFGAHARALPGADDSLRGASMGAAWFAAACHQLLTDDADLPSLMERLQARSTFHGRERRGDDIRERRGDDGL